MDVMYGPLRDHVKSRITKNVVKKKNTKPIPKFIHGKIISSNAFVIVEERAKEPVAVETRVRLFYPMQKDGDEILMSGYYLNRGNLIQGRFCLYNEKTKESYIGDLSL
jgi:hypothetical protein